MCKEAEVGLLRWHISAINSGFWHSEKDSFSGIIVTGLKKP